jgi:hypothetical protein
MSGVSPWITRGNERDGRANLVLMCIFWCGPFSFVGKDQQRDEKVHPKNEVSTSRAGRKEGGGGGLAFSEPFQASGRS